MLNARQQVNHVSQQHPDDTIPSIFCWTKMGTEAGQSLDAILRRKELERSAGNGSFAWGIGNSLGHSASMAKRESPTGEVDVLFTPMKSAPKIVDVTPSQIFIWLYYENSVGSISVLPEHMLITSRGSENKRAHYALLCHSPDKIEASDHGGFDASCVRNLSSMNPVGASQVTSVVRYQNMNVDQKPYRISFKAKLHGEGFVKLIEPIVIDETLITMYEEACQASTPQAWFRAVAVLKGSALRKVRKLNQQIEMFA